jgi:hypothetical protein
MKGIQDALAKTSGSRTMDGQRRMTAGNLKMSNINKPIHTYISVVKI